MVVSDVTIVPEFVFMEELTEVPMVRQVGFRIDLVPGTAPVVKAPYRLTGPNRRTS